MEDEPAGGLEVESVVSMRGAEQLVHEGHRYRRKCTSAFSIRWECVHKHRLQCRGSITTTNSHPYLRPSNPTAHTHPADPLVEVEAEVTRLRLAMREAAAQGRPIDVIRRTMEDAPQEVRARLGTIDSLKRDVRRYRRLAHPVPAVPQGGVGSVGVAGGGQGSPGPTKKPPASAPVVAPAPAPTPAPPEVCLRWNSYHTNMQATFPSLLNNEQFVDVTLACDGRSIKCHKVMLSACSSYFEELLSQNPCQHPIVVMRDLKFWEVQALVEFMYTGEVNVAQDKLPSLLSAAEALQIKGLTSSSSSSSGGSSYQQEEESNSTGGFVGTPSTTSNVNDHDEVVGMYQQPAKRPRKRKPTNPVPYQHKTQMMYSGLNDLQEAGRLGMMGAGGGTPVGGRASPLCLVQPPRHSTLSPKVRHDSPAHLPPPHPPFGLNPVKSEPDESYDTCLDLSECDSSRKEPCPQTLNLSTSVNQPPPIQGRVCPATNGTSSPGPAPSLPTNLSVKRDPPTLSAPPPLSGPTTVPGNTSLSEEEEHSSECSEPHPLDPNQDL